MTDKELIDLADRVERGEALGDEATRRRLNIRPIYVLLVEAGLLLDIPPHTEFWFCVESRCYLSAVKALEGECDMDLFLRLPKRAGAYNHKTGEMLGAECTGPDAEERARLAALLRLRADERESGDGSV